MEAQTRKGVFSHFSKPMPHCKPSLSFAAQLHTPARGGVHVNVSAPLWYCTVSLGLGKKSHLLPCNNLFLQKASSFTAG